MITADEVKRFARAQGADLVGIAPMSRWEGAPRQMDPRTIAPRAKSMEWAKLNPLACEKGIQGGYERELNPFLKEYPRRYGYGRALGGAFGCIRACMDHLEKTGVLQNRFRTPFRTAPPWKLDHSKPHPPTDDVRETYIETGKVEDADAYITYNKRDNYGTGRDAKAPNPLID